MVDLRIAMLWPTSSNYDRFREISEDKLRSTYKSYVTDARRKLDKLAKRGVVIKLVDFDPDDLLRWCRSNGLRVDPEGRAEYAAFLAEARYGS